MNGHNDKHLDDDNFGPSDALSAVRAFDAFPKTKSSYKTQSESGGRWTIVLVLASLWLVSAEFARWWKGDTTHAFSVEQGVGHDLQVNLDVVVAMKCDDIHVNIQDAAGDRILARHSLATAATSWKAWDAVMAHELPKDKQDRLNLEGATSHKREYQEDDVHDYLGAASQRKKWRKMPKTPRGAQEDSCRIFGSIHSNKVTGDFHITARGHGYMEFGQHLDHKAFNFTHHVNELSFGPFYPSLENPLDDTVSITKRHFYKYQYFLSVVPTIYTTDVKSLKKIGKKYESPNSGSDGLEQHPLRHSKNTVFTNQYSVTEQSREVAENLVPGIFIKYDIEPIMLTIAEEWDSFPSLFIRIVNVVSGILVAGGWLYQLVERAKDIRARGRQHGYEGAMITPVSAKGEKQDFQQQSNGYAANGYGLQAGNGLFSPMGTGQANQKNDLYSPVNARVPIITRPQKERAE